MPENAAPNPQADADQLEAATDQAISVCGGNARDTVKALLVANEYLESEVQECRPLSRPDTRAATSSEGSRLTLVEYHA
jgi:hypothetical protein